MTEEGRPGKRAKANSGNIVANVNIARRDDQSMASTFSSGGRGEEIRRIISYQLDLEILHKLREARVVEEEMERGEAMKELLEKLVINEYIYGAGSGGGMANLDSKNIFKGASVVSTPTTAQILEAYTGSSPGRRSTRAVSFAAGGGGGGRGDRPQSEPQAQYEVKPDGTVVRMRCPKCGADMFRSMLGFLNHCRIHCRLVFSSQDDRLQRCGVPIDSAEVPTDYFTKHPTQLKQEMDLALIRAGVHGPTSDTTKRPMIKVEGADVDGVYPLLPGSAGGEPEVAREAFNGSRYYVKRKIIIGNSAKNLLVGNSKKDQTSIDTTKDNDAEKESPLADDRKTPTHKWRLYVKAAKSDASGGDATTDPASFIKGVRFFLHPSYKPNDIADVITSSVPGSFTPLELTRTGWGEFPVRVQLHFWDPRNRPIEIIHFLRVLTATTGKFVVTAEQAYDVEIDRKTEFLLNPTLPAPKGEMVLPALLATVQGRVTDVDLLEMVIDDFPLAGIVGRRAKEVNYRPRFRSMEDFLRKNLAEQRAEELNRAKAVCDYLVSTFAAFSLSQEDVIKWCREKGNTPSSVASLVSAMEHAEGPMGSQLLYCRFCGLAHLPQSKFDILQRNCSLRPRKIHLSSRTASADLMKKFNLLPENADVVKRLKQEYLGPAFLPHHTNGQRAIHHFDEQNLTNDDAVALWTLDRVQELHLSHCPSHSSSASARAHHEGISNLVTASMKAFLRDLINASVGEIPESKERTNDRPVLLTPLHMYRAITSRPLFDFLGNAFMLGGTGTGSGSGGGAGSGKNRVVEKNLED